MWLPSCGLPPHGSKPLLLYYFLLLKHLLLLLIISLEFLEECFLLFSAHIQELLLLFCTQLLDLLLHVWGQLGQESGQLSHVALALFGAYMRSPTYQVAGDGV